MLALARVPLPPTLKFVDLYGNPAFDDRPVALLGIRRFYLHSAPSLLFSPRSDVQTDQMLKKLARIRRGERVNGREECKLVLAPPRAPLLLTLKLGDLHGNPDPDDRPGVPLLTRCFSLQLATSPLEAQTWR